LSQLIDVSEDHPERQSIRNRFSQLVADFVLCRSNLSVVAVIELDDRSHERADRQLADARKNKALADSGIRLVRIPAGTLPSAAKLRDMIDAERGTDDQAIEANAPRFVRAESGLELADDWGSVGAGTMVGPAESRDSELRAFKRSALKTALGAATLVGGWFLYSQLLPVLVHRSLQPLAVQHVMVTSPSIAVTSRASSNVPVASVPGELSVEDSAATKRAELQVATAARKQKELAWSVFYSTPESCEHPTDWTAQVECGNRYMRAKKEFDNHWIALHAAVPGSGGAVVLDNESIGAARK
jgi:hypothetical protein